MVWLPVFGIFNEHTDVDACGCTLHWKLTLGEISPAAPGTRTRVIIAPGFFSRTLYQLSCPGPILAAFDPRLAPLRKLCRQLTFYMLMEVNYQNLRLNVKTDVSNNNFSDEWYNTQVDSSGERT